MTAKKICITGLVGLLTAGVCSHCSKKDKDEDEIFVPTLYMHGMAQTGGNAVISFGGINYDKMDNAAYKYNIQQNEWQALNPAEKPHARSQFGMCYGGNQTIVIFGGWYNDDIHNYQSGYVMYNDVWKFDISTGTWYDTQIDSGRPEKRRWMAMAYAGNSKIVLFGGDIYYTSAGTEVNTYLGNDTWVYDVESNTWEHVIPDTCPGNRAYHVMAFCGDNKVLLFGGTNWETENPFNFSDTWEFDVTAKTWTRVEPTGAHPSGRSNAAMTYAGDSLIILFGGNTDAQGTGTYMNDTWEYSITDKTWTEISPGSSLPPATIHHKMAYGGNNKVYLHGGVGAASTGSVWEYDVQAKTWKELLRQTGM